MFCYQYVIFTGGEFLGDSVKLIVTIKAKGYEKH